MTVRVTAADDPQPNPSESAGSTGSATPAFSPGSQTHTSNNLRPSYRSRRSARRPGAPRRSTEPDAIPLPSEEAYQGFDRGDDAHIRTVFRYWYGRLVDYVEGTFRLHFEDAKDIAQQAFIKALRATPAQHGVPVPVRLFAIARYKALEHSRKSKRRAALVDTYVSDAVRHVPMPDDTAYCWMQVDEILQALEAFPDPEYTAFVMRRIQGYSYSEIGQLFGWSNQRTTDVVHQTWRRLQRLLGIERL